MTYNFDPEQWYEMEKAALDRKHRAGQLDDDEYQKALADLGLRLAEMWERLDGTFRIPE